MAIPFTPLRLTMALSGLTALAIACGRSSPPSHSPRRCEFGGTTRDAAYRVRIGDSRLDESALNRLRQDTADMMAALEHQFSRHAPDSTLSRFNAVTSAGPVSVSRELLEVTGASLAIAAATDGAFDPTALPLLQVWEQARQSATGAPPSAAAIAAARARVGYHGVAIAGQELLLKARPDTSMDLTGIAQGYTADRIAALVRSRGGTNVLVTLGENVIAYGESAPGQPWRAEILVPDGEPGHVSNRVRRLLLTNQALATTGDCRSLIETGGRPPPLVLDPRTGMAVTNRVASVSVLAPTCVAAEAYATALRVLGPDQGLALISRHRDLAALFILREPGGGFATAASPGFPP